MSAFRFDDWHAAAVRLEHDEYIPLDRADLRDALRRVLRGNAERPGAP